MNMIQRNESRKRLFLLGRTDESLAKEILFLDGMMSLVTDAMEDIALSLDDFGCKIDDLETMVEEIRENLDVLSEKAEAYLIVCEKPSNSDTPTTF